MDVAHQLRQRRWTALDLLYPSRCAGCGSFGRDLCADCAPTLVPTHAGRCESAVTVGAPTRCPSCADWRALDGAVAAYRLDGLARKLVHGYKYEFRASMATTLAEAMAPLRQRVAFDVAFAVPLHRSRVRKTAQQVGQALTERRRNVAGAFAYRGPALTGLSVALVDDVVTTGATAEECAKVLKANGAVRVTAVAYARASWKPEERRSVIAD